jgi:glycerophosphoryl diester phosphodiesterase
LERTTNGSGAVMTQSLAYLRSLDAGDGQQIPTLAEVFDLVDRRVGINVELKGPGTAEPAVRFLEARMAQGWQTEQLLVSSFNHQMLRVVRQLDPQIRLGALVFEMPPGRARFGQELGAYSVNPWVRAVTREFVQDAHARGLLVFVYTVNEPEDIARMRQMRVDGVFTNYPERVLA